MTDIYVAYAREDRDRLRLLSEMLRYEGWNVWMDPSDAPKEHTAALDKKLAAAGVILAIWSDRARVSEHVRSEAATGLYKNKLVQIRIDNGAPPRPFDQVELLDLGYWRGDQEDPTWRRLNAALRTIAGEPQGVRPLPARKQAAAAPAPAPSQSAPWPARSPIPPPQPSAPPLYLDRPAFEPPPPPRQAAAAPAYVERPTYAAPPPAPPAYAERSTFVAPPPAAPAPSYADRPSYAPPPPNYEARPTYTPPPLQPAPRPQPAPSQQPLLMPLESSSGPWRASGSSYPGSRRTATWGPIAAAAVLIFSGVGLWFGDPFGWRSGGSGEADPLALAARTVGDANVAGGVPATASFEDTDESNGSWARVNRKNPEALRDFVVEFPRATTAETARSLLRVLDAQAWVTAVTADNEGAYQVYLKRFPVEGDMPGAMATAARDRLAALGGERQQAIEEIQRGLAALNIFEGEPDGKGGPGTARAIKVFADTKHIAAPALATASPRDLRMFIDALRRAGSQSSPSAALSAAMEADKQRVAQAQAQAQAVSLAVDPEADGAADALAMGQQQRIAEAEAWDIAERSGTLASYQAYLTAWPSGPHLAAAKAAVTRLNRPAAYSLEQTSGDVKSVVEAARRAQVTANQRASAARQAATSVDSLADARSIVGADGDRYNAQFASGAPNGLGSRVRGAGVNTGDRYRGELRNGQSSGVGVYEFANNTANAGARAARYEGEYAGDVATGYGVMYWQSGDSFAGQGAGSSGQARGVLTYSNGQRYEGDLTGGQRNGYGVVWAADGSISQAGRWVRDDLVEPMKAP